MSSTRQELKQNITSNIKTNGRQSITGQVLQDVLVDMANSVVVGQDPPFIQGAGSGSAQLRTETSFATGILSVAEGDITSASGNYSHAEGYNTTAQNVAEHSCGKYNISHLEGASQSGTIHSVGVGYYDNVESQSVYLNAIEVLSNGNVYIKGVGGYNGANPYSSTPIQDAISAGSSASIDIASNAEIDALFDEIDFADLESDGSEGSIVL